MNEFELCADLGTKATFFGLGLLASKKMRPYAKYFIIGGIALSAAPVVMELVERKKLRRLELEDEVDEVDEVLLDENGEPIEAEEEEHDLAAVLADEDDEEPEERIIIEIPLVESNSEEEPEDE